MSKNTGEGRGEGGERLTGAMLYLPPMALTGVDISPAPSVKTMDLTLWEATPELSLGLNA